MAKRVTEEEKARMLELRVGGMSYDAIGVEIGRSATSVALVCDPARKIAWSAHMKAYQGTPECKAYSKKYELDAKRIAYRKKYAQSPERKVSREKYTHSEKGKATVAVRRQSLQYRDYQTRYQRGAGCLAANLRKRLRLAIIGNFKAGSAVNDLGCTINDLKAYLETQFSPEMTWDNWSIDGWHLDHIKPLASFDLTDREQFLEACHYSNLQPLWAQENLSKGAKLGVGEHKIIDNGGD